MKRKPLYLSQQTTKQFNTTTMKTAIYTDQMTSGNPVKVQVNRYAKGNWPAGFDTKAKNTYEYELVVNGEVEYLFKDTLRGAKSRGYQTLCLRWAQENRD